MGVTNQPDQQEQRKMKALDASLDWCKQIITLATGTLVLSGTFIKDIVSGDIKVSILILVCWIAMCASAVFGVLYLASVTSLLASPGKELDPYAQPNSGIAIIQILTFIVGLVAFVIFVSINL